MRLQCQSTSANFKFEKASKIDLEVIDLSEKGFSKEPLALAQTMFKFCFNRDGKRRSLKKNRHDQSKETPFPLCVAIKICSHSRSKTMINWFYFKAGILISYDWLLNITRDLSNQILNQYERDGVFIPCNLKKNIFTIIAKDNIDHNARSTTATNTSFSVFQFHLQLSQMIWFLILISFVQPLSRVIRKKLIAFPHHTQKFEDSFHHLLHLHFQHYRSQSYLILTILFTSKQNSEQTSME